MIKRMIIVQHKFGLSTPKTQRVLAAARTYYNQGIEVVFVISQKQDEKIRTNYPDFKFIILKEANSIKCYQSFYKEIKKQYNHNTLILFYSVPVYSFLFRKNKYNVFSEITEIPFYGKKASFIAGLKEKLRLYALRNFDGLLVISNALKEYYERKKINNLMVYNMFVDSSRFEELKKTNNGKYIGYCGTLSLYKDGVDVLIKSFSIFEKRHPNYQLYLLGPFESKAVESELKNMAAHLGLSKKVIFTGPVNPSEMPQWLYDADILALSRPDNIQAKYGFPTKLGEYLATGNPVVVTSVGEIPLFLKDGENAFVVASGDADSFADKLSWVADNYEQANAIGVQGRSLVENEFSSEIQSLNALKFMISTIEQK